jgi:F-type H+-transporting ATPase subunit b
VKPWTSAASALIEEFFSGVRAGKVTVLEGESLSGASAEITSALPLTPAEQEAVKRDVLSKIGAQATVTFRVDPSILGGLVVRVGDKVLDGSVSGQLEGLQPSALDFAHLIITARLRRASVSLATWRLCY